MAIKEILTKRPYWTIFAVVQLAGFILFILVRTGFSNRMAMLLLLPGSLIGIASAGWVALILGVNALPGWLWFVVVPGVPLAINFAAWYAATILLGNKPPAH
jgi:hypothetical protein